MQPGCNSREVVLMSLQCGKNLLGKSFCQRGITILVSEKVHESPDGMGTHRESPEGMGTHPATAAPHLGAFSRSKEFVTAGTEGICDAGMFAWVTANTCPHPAHPKMHMLLSLWLSGRDLVTVSL